MHLCSLAKPLRIRARRAKYARLPPHWNSYLCLIVSHPSSNLLADSSLKIMAKNNTRHAATDLRRPKAVRKPALPSAPKSIDFPIDKLPAELVHMICVYLKPTEIANLRLVSRLAAPIGLQYMVPEVHLILAKDSFEQLKTLAEHPIASKCVTSFFFEADKLGLLLRKRWEHIVTGPQYIAQVEELHMRHPCPHASDRSVRTFNREASKMSAAPRHHYTEEQMDHAFEHYCDFTYFQQGSEEAAVQEKEVVEAMKHFPHVKELTMSTQCCARIRTSRLRKTFEPAFCTYYEIDNPRDTKLEPLGLRQMRSLLLGAYQAGLKVKALHCGVVSWRILKQDTETFARMRNSVSNLKNLRLEFATGLGQDDDYSLEELEIESCASYLEAGRLRDFVTAAPNLEHLRIGFQFNEPTWPTHLKYVVGEHHWPSLKTFELKMIATSEDDLVSFCSRHASTLKSLYLSSIGLLDGDWFSAFNKMRKILTLDSMVVLGRLEGLDEGLDFEVGSEEYCPELKEGIEAYFMGPCSSDKSSLDEFLDSYLPNSDDTWSEWDSSDGWW